MVNDPGKDRRRRTSSIAEAYRISHEAMSAVMAVAVFTGLGYWLDGRYGCSPVLTICGICLGSVAAGFSLRELLRRLDKDSKRSKRSEADDRETKT
jgi:F0F1-type ATP synthase assembly protein I